MTIFRDDGDRLTFVGDFDGHYARHSDPWDQSGAFGPMASYYAASRARLAEALTRHCRAGTVLEVGCGHGHVLPIIELALNFGDCHGLDISAKAIETARVLYPQSSFFVGDISSPASIAALPLATGYQAVILNQALWYVLERMDATVANLHRLAAGGLVIVSQAFLRGPQRYGADIADGFHGAVAMFLSRYPQLRLIEAQYDDSDAHQHHDGLLVFRAVNP